MELIWKELEAERLFERRRVQVRIEGELPSPDGRSIAEVISCTGRVCLTGASAEADEVRLEGRIDVMLTVSDGEGAPFGFESGANFRHTVSLPGAHKGMIAAAIPSVQSLTAIPRGASAGLEASVDIDLRVVSAAPMRVTGGVDGVSDLELKTVSAAHGSLRETGRETLRLREELSAEGLGDVLSCEGFVSIRDVSLEDGAASVSGQVSVSAIVLDREGRLCQLVRSLPFRERIAADSPSGEAYCRAELKSLYLRSLGEDFGIAAMEAEIDFTVLTLERKTVNVPVDAFSPSIGFGCLSESVNVTEDLGRISLRLSLQEELRLPEGSEAAKRPVCASAVPVITEAVPEDGRIELNGVLVTSAVYENGSGSLSAFACDVPFSASMEAPAGVNAVMASAACVCELKGAGAESLAAEYTLELDADCYREEELSVLAGLAECERPERPHGISVCFASGGEDAFDAAKRFGIPCRLVRELNPDVKEPYSEGDKLIVLA